MESTESLLRRYWKHEAFREPQKEIIEDLLQDKDVLAVLPTGSGKSLCYQLPTLLKPGVCLVVSPLIALMQDQVASLRRKEIKALYLESGKSRSEVVQDFDNLRFGNYKFLYLSPEKLQSPWIQEKIRSLDVSLIAIDEAHCISQWGHDFRPSYTKLSLLDELLPGVPKIALTATANERVRRDIAEHLNLNEASYYTRSFNRENLTLEIRKSPDLQDSLKFLLSGNKDPGILYVGTRKDTIFYSRFLNHHGIKASFFHGGMDQKEKSRALQNWISEEAPLIVATNAFGMGIDKSNVRRVVHCHLPQSPENYLQEIGRAGRDGKGAYAVLLYNEQMLLRASEWRKKSMADPAFTMSVYQKLCDYYQVPHGACPKEPFDFSLEHFCHTYQFPAARCHAALGHLEQDGVLLVDHNAKESSSVQISIRGKALYDLAQEKNPSGKILQSLLRRYGGILEQRISIAENAIGKSLSMPITEVIRSLQELHRRGVLEYRPKAKAGTLQFLMPREESFIKSGIRKSIEIRNRNKEMLARSMEDFVTNDKVCRILQLAAYFGEDNKQACGHCDVCRKKLHRPKNFKQLENEIHDLLSKKGPCSVLAISKAIGQEQDLVVKTIEIMMEKERLALNLQNKIVLKS